jgi:hypothetical protein
MCTELKMPDNIATIRFQKQSAAILFASPRGQPSVLIDGFDGW